MVKIAPYDALEYHLEQAIECINNENYDKLYIHIWQINYMYKLIKIKKEWEFGPVEDINNPDFGI